MSRRTTPTQSNAPRSQPPVYPFTAIVGQQEMKLALLLNVIEPAIGGVLIMGHRGTGKSTAVRALADLLPPIWKVRDCLYGCDPSEQDNLCADCAEHLEAGGKLPRTRAHVPVVDLPLGATEDRVCGAINIERALTEGVKAFDTGLLAHAHRGFLYIDEVNLLEDHLVDLLLDVAVTGRNRVEREGISVEHPARFVLVGSGNPEEGELRPQLIDRFGLHVEVMTSNDLDERVQIILAREEFERDPAGFRASLENEQENLRLRLKRARKKVHEVKVSVKLLRRIAELCVRLKVDGHRGELTITRAARALAAFEGRREATAEDVRRVAKMSLRHRLRRDPLEQTTDGARIEQALDNLFPTPDPREKQPRDVSEREHDDIPPSGFTGDGDGHGGTDGGAKNSGGGTRGGQSSSARTNSAPALDARLPEDALGSESRAAAQPRAQAQSARRQGNVRRSIYNNRRGRYARSVITPSSESKIALDATLRAAARRKVGTGGWGSGVSEEKPTTSPSSPTASHQPLSPFDLRFKRFKRKNGTLFIFAIDASGSMALNRISQAKGALVHLLQRSYIRRDSVAIVSFREQRADLLLPPCRSIARARRILDSICVGGSTPLAAGLASSLDVAQRATRQGAQEIILLLFTDGRANVSLRACETLAQTRRQPFIDREIEHLGAALKQAGVAATVVDTQSRFTSRGEGRVLADKLHGRYVYFGADGAAISKRLSALDL